ncbi:MAG: PD40 domain-containing protein, partial [Gemmatimonadetes bacterium]|nr:PD40 domain-containing protein [Gemmatimonadota bacterium]
MPRLAVLAAAVLLLPATAAAQQGRAFTPADWYRVTTLSSPAMSPDGRLVAVTVTTVKEKENTRHSEVWVVPAAGGEAVRYTSPSTESSNPRWSHDGTYLFFTSRREGGDGTTWALRMDVPAGEAQQLTTYPAGSIPRDGSFAVFTAPADGDEDDEAETSDSTIKDPYQKMPAMARPPFGAITTPLDPRRFDGRHIVDLGYKANGRGFVPNRREPRTDRPQQLWRQPFGDTAKTRITDTPYSHRSAVVSPDGRWIAFVADARLRPDSVVRAERDSLAPLPYDAARDEAPRNDTDIFVIAIDGGTPRRLTTLDGNEGSLAWSPDGRSLAFTSSTTRTGQEELRIVDVAGGTPREVIGDWRYEPGDIEWTPDGQILMTAAIGGRTALFRV